MPLTLHKLNFLVSHLKKGRKMLHSERSTQTHTPAGTYKHQCKVKPRFQLIRYPLATGTKQAAKEQYIIVCAPHYTFLSFSIISSMRMSPFWETLLSICVSHSQSSLFFSLNTAHSFSLSLTCCRRKETLKHLQRVNKNKIVNASKRCLKHFAPQCELLCPGKSAPATYLSLKQRGLVLQKLCVTLCEFRGKC